MPVPCSFMGKAWAAFNADGRPVGTFEYSSASFLAWRRGNRHDDRRTGIRRALATEMAPRWQCLGCCSTVAAAWAASCPACTIRTSAEPRIGCSPKPFEPRLEACKSPLKMPSKTGCIFGRSLAHSLFRWDATPFACQRI